MRLTSLPSCRRFNISNGNAVSFFPQHHPFQPTLVIGQRVVRTLVQAPAFSPDTGGVSYQPGCQNKVFGFYGLHQVFCTVDPHAFPLNLFNCVKTPAQVAGAARNPEIIPANLLQFPSDPARRVT